jgi:hypothetical protein
MTRYDSDVALVLVLVVFGFLIRLLIDVYLEWAADVLCLQLGLLGILASLDSESGTLVIHSSLSSSLASGPPKCDVSHLVIT